MGAFQTVVTPYKQSTMLAAVSFPEKMRAELQENEWPDMWRAAFKARLARGERDAVRLYAEIMRLVDGERDLLALALSALGVSLDVARKAVGMYREAEGVDDSALTAYSIEHLTKLGYRCLPPESSVDGPSLPVAAIGPASTTGAPEGNGKRS